MINGDTLSRKPVLIIVFLLLFLQFFTYSRFQQNRVKASDSYPVHNLNTGLNYTTIQEAINANETLDGQIIHVDSGTYDERITISKSISLIGEGGNTTIINGTGKLWAVSINANNVTFSGFMVEEGGRGLNIIINGGIFIISNNCRVYDNTIRYSDNYGAGIQLPGDFVSGNIVENNTITNCTYGILSGGNNCELTNNIVKNCYSGAAVQGNNNVLRNNSFADNRFDFGANGIQDIDETNLVSGKPIIYWIDQHDRETPVNAGYVSLLNCVNITIAGMIASNVSEGISLVNTTNSVIRDTILSDCENSCIYLFNSSGNTVENSSLNGGSDLVQITFSNSNRIDRCVMNGSVYGVSARYSEHNSITDSLFENNYEDIDIVACGDINVYHNNFINGTKVSTFTSNITLDNGFEGNYWSDYNGTDSNHDGIGDTPHVIDANNTDHYPLMGTFQSFIVRANAPPLSRLEEIEVISNSTIGNVNVSQAFQPTDYGWFLELTGVTGLEGTTGFCRITFANDIINASYYQVLINGTFTSSSRIVGSNGTYTTVYFTYVHPVFGSVIEVFPEFPSFLVLPLFFITTLFAVIFYKRRHLPRA